MGKKDLIAVYRSLFDENKFSESNDRKRRGREFEILIRDLLKIEGLEPSLKNYRPKGEEIDGSFLLGYKTYLLETKWHKDPLPASSIYQFKGKVDGKLVGTIGVFISMSGFSKDSVDALMYGKTMNVILFDQYDIDNCFKIENSFKNLFLKKLRAATEVGIPFYSLKSADIEIEYGTSFSAANPKVCQDILIIVEGASDQRIISLLAKIILEENNLVRNVSVRIAGGKVAIPKLLKLISREEDITEIKVILVADSDWDIQETTDLLLDGVSDSLNPVLILPEPNIDVWGKQFETTSTRGLMGRGFSIPLDIKLSRLNIELLKNSDESFNLFYKALIS